MYVGGIRADGIIKLRAQGSYSNNRTGIFSLFNPFPPRLLVQMRLSHVFEQWRKIRLSLFLYMGFYFFFSPPFGSQKRRDEALSASRPDMLMFAAGARAGGGAKDELDRGNVSAVAIPGHFGRGRPRQNK